MILFQIIDKINNSKEDKSLILENKNLNFKGSLEKRQKPDINEILNNDLLKEFINDIKEYMIDERYIKINKKGKQRT